MYNCVRKLELPNGLTLFVSDATRRYYEDYHLVRLEIVCETPVLAEYFDTGELYAEARELLGESAVYRRLLEKMGVPFREIETARENLMKGFEGTALRYFSAEGFPRKMVLSEFAKAREKAGRSRC
jgi:hypothetical protein